MPIALFVLYDVFVTTTITSPSEVYLITSYTQPVKVSEHLYGEVHIQSPNDSAWYTNDKLSKLGMSVAQLRALRLGGKVVCSKIFYKASAVLQRKVADSDGYRCNFLGKQFARAKSPGKSFIAPQIPSPQPRRLCFS